MTNHLKKCDKLSATVSGVTAKNVEFTQDLTFELIPPTDNNHYGTGCYMHITLLTSNDRPSDDFHTYYEVDVRYEKTTDIQLLAERWIADFYGQNAHRIAMSVFYE